jgi:hypothetical protein
MSDDIHIEVMHSIDANYSGAADIVSNVDCDKGPLAMPKHIKIGAQGTKCGGDHDYKIRNYGDQVDEYAIWLGEQIEAGNQEIMGALEEIFIKAQGVGVILTTICMPSPYITHAHQVKRIIMELASEGE